MQKSGTHRKNKPTDPFYSSLPWRKAREGALRRAGWCCENCGGNVRKRGTSRVHHKLPRRKFPELALHPPNLQVLCVPCDNATHHWDRAAHGSRGDVPEIGLDGFPVGSDWSES